MLSLGPLRGHLAVARGYTGRALTLAGTAGLATAAFTTGPLPYIVTISGAGAATVYGLIWSATLPKGRIRDAATALYLTPPVTAAGLLVTERLVHGVHWWELALDAAWALATWKVRPARMARVLSGRERSLTVEAVQEFQQEQAAALIPAGSTHPMSLWWAQRVAIEGGVAPGTVLQDIELTGPKSMTGLIRAAVPGTPVPTISITALSALLDWDEEEISVAKVAGRGAGVRRLSVGQAPEAQDPYTHWMKNIAPKGMPGTSITDIRIVDTDTKELH
ncbi:hypothetical protein [Kitasatospora sp. MBT66]|uniref:hypothetical protein n=1 Tax=Kitasatospora sp. MBT66 TaxID=1444769 RepID=UPI0005B7843B|nr:hypothetical protein [Kitasatospora sp. MBT66]